MRVAVVQLEPLLAEPRRNVDIIEQKLAEAAAEGAELAVFPECAVSGYMFQSLEEARAVAEPIPGESSDRIIAAASAHGIYAVVGMLERSGEDVFNSAVLVGPDGLVAVYRKTHTLCLGVDRFTTPGGGPYEVHDLPIGKVGVLICYDLRFPEAARALALAGAQVIALPTNWPEKSHIQPDVFTRSRAAENHVYILAANRVGNERAAHFLGRSQIVLPTGRVLVEAPTDDEAMLIRDIDPRRADEKNVVVAPGEHEMDCFGDRRPDLYGSLVRQEFLAEVR